MHRYIAPLLLTVASTASPAFAVLSITYDQTNARVSDGTLSNVSNILNSGGAVAAATLPSYSSTTTSLYNPTSMSVSFVQSRLGPLFAVASGEANVEFTTDSIVAYTATGNYSSSGGFSQLYSFLYDTTTSTFPFKSEQDSNGVLAVFTVGGSAGNYYNGFTGSLTGSLPAGHHFQWHTNAYTGVSFAADGGATGSGGGSLTLVAAVPEPSSLIVCSLLVFSFGIVGQRQRSAFRLDRDF